MVRQTALTQGPAARAEDTLLGLSEASTALLLLPFSSTVHFWIVSGPRPLGLQAQLTSYSYKTKLQI